MRITPLLQPYMPTDTALAVLQRWLSERPAGEVTMVSAWGKASALSLLEESIASFKADGGRLELFLGLSQGGATEQGLEMALDLANKTYVIFDPSGRTFHPKLYLHRDARSFSALIGSQNLTAGGLQTNYEAGLLIEGTFFNRDDMEVLGKLEDYVETLRVDVDICKPLDERLLKALIADPAIPIGSEATSENEAPSAERSGAETSLFAPSAMQLVYGHRRRRPTSRSIRAPQPQGEVNALRQYDVNENTGAFWSKRLPRSDAMRLPNAHPTAHLALTQAGYPIDPAVYFRNDFFAGCEWIPTLDRDRLREEALVPFTVRGLFRSVRTVQLQIDHTPSWQSSQGNRATSIRWGDLFPVLREEVDVTGLELVIERSVHQTFQMTFTHNFN
ncbi:phospholipase D family protein [Curtobacterium sp. MCBD17_032]|uniref:phospholipase D family protein n=1 Tax=Curtobacterium sp. MCBD17_032 TaxID=2175659 RepID=UPI001C64CCF9|nr:phospholipase D family protein [Curtobacterium sp. MCBD17_032]